MPTLLQIATIISALIVDRYGRRPLLLISEVLTVVSLFFLSLFFFLKGGPEAEEGGVLLVYFQWLPLASLTLFMVAFSMGIGPIGK
jgi:SP family facilitated glucose transporter-like MFS transporter 8